MAAVAVILSLKAISSTRRRGMAADNPRAPRNLPYIFRRDFIPPSQRPFFAVLLEAVEDKLLICPKPHLADVIAPRSSLAPRLQEAALDQISRQHVDFLLVAKKDCVPVAVVELDDGKQWPLARMERDVMVHEALRSAGLAVFRIPAGVSSDSAALRELLAPVLTPDPAMLHGAGTRPPFAAMAASWSPPPFASAPARHARTLVELQEERNRTRAPFPVKEKRETRIA